MAESLQQIKKRIKTANSIAQISKAMEMIAASKNQESPECG
jgi:F-type H+-transporting ATPase subunit gamma